MVNNLYKKKVTSLIARAKQRGAIKSYSQFCETNRGKETALSKDEIIYYTSKDKGETK